VQLGDGSLVQVKVGARPTKTKKEILLVSRLTISEEILSVTSTKQSTNWRTEVLAGSVLSLLNAKRAFWNQSFNGPECRAH
jgi:hypothetical protein